MRNTNFRAVVIGASAGALEALMTILPKLPKDYPLPILVVVHLPPDNGSLMAELLDAKCELAVCEGEDKQMLEAGHVYFAPPDYHMLVENDHSISLSNDEPVFYSRPSIDVLFESAADAYGKHLMGVILTGGNADGASGLQLIAKRGGRAVVQDPKEAMTSAMPTAALEACPKAAKMTLDKIATHLNELTM